MSSDSARERIAFGLYIRGVRSGDIGLLLGVTSETIRRGLAGRGKKISARLRMLHQTARFWDKVMKCGPVHPLLGTRCWLWTGAVSNFGHGHLGWDGEQVTAHRKAWELIRGRKPPAHKCVLHACDVPNCVRHLFLGTQRDNVHDMIAKGRRADVGTGEANARSKLTWAIVRGIRQSYRRGTPQSELRRIYGLSSGRISEVVNHKCW